MLALAGQGSSRLPPSGRADLSSSGSKGAECRGYDQQYQLGLSALPDCACNTIQSMVSEV